MRLSEPQLIELGRVVGAHALKGEVRVRFSGDGPDSLLSFRRVWLASHEGDVEARCFEVVRVGSGRAGEVRLALQGVLDRTAAEALRGLVVFGAEADLAPLEDGEYYWYQLVGCAVETQEGEPIGRVREIWETGAHDVLVIDAQDGRQVLVPTAREIMKRVDLTDRRIAIEAIPGLLDQ